MSRMKFKRKEVRTKFYTTQLNLDLKLQKEDEEDHKKKGMI